MLQGLAVYLLWFCILLSFKFFLLSEESIAENHWCSLRSAQTHVKENWGFVSPSFFPLILDGHNNGICQLRLLLLEPQMPCPKCLHLSGQFWSLCYCVISGGTQHPPPQNFSNAFWNIFHLKGFHSAKRRQQREWSLAF